MHINNIKKKQIDMYNKNKTYLKHKYDQVLLL